MYDEDDELQPQQNNAPTLPRELREKLFAIAEGLPALRYQGPELWPQRVVMGGEFGFTKWHNPTSSVVKMVFNLGPDPQLHVGFEMKLIPPQYRASRGFAAERTKTGRAIRNEYCRLLCEIPPGGTLELPSEFNRAIRTPAKDNPDLIIGGHAPMLLKVGETNPPELHSSLVPADDGSPPFTSGPAAARRLT